MLYIFLDWHLARIKTVADLIWGGSKQRQIKELAIYIGSEGRLRGKISKIERLFLNQFIYR